MISEKKVCKCFRNYIISKSHMWRERKRFPIYLAWTVLAGLYFSYMFVLLRFFSSHRFSLLFFYKLICYFPTTIPSHSIFKNSADLVLPTSQFTSYYTNGFFKWDWPPIWVKDSSPPTQHTHTYTQILQANLISCLPKLKS